MFDNGGGRDYEVMRIPSMVESGYEVVDTATMALSQRMIACLDNDKMSDVHLVGEDSIKVPACKFVLGSTSANLQTLLYNGPNKSTVNFPNCRFKTLKALVEFSCSDMLNTTIWSDTEPVEIVEDMIALAKLAQQYVLPNLKQQVSDVLAPCLEQLPSLACVAYNLVDTKSTAELHESSLEVLRKKPYQAFVKGPGGEIGGIACLSPDKLDQIFRDKEVNAEEIFLFQCLQEWKASNQDTYSNTNQICRLVAQHLDFSAMHASDIEDIVLPSGIVDSGSLVTGLMMLAKAAEKKGVHLRSSRRKLGKQSHSKSSEASLTKPGGRGRRFKKPDSPSVGDSYTASYGDETRDDGAPVSEIQTSSMHPTSPGGTKSRVMNFRPPKSFTARATKFLGAFRHHTHKEETVEAEIPQAPVPVQKKAPAPAKAAPVKAAPVKAKLSSVRGSASEASGNEEDDDASVKDEAGEIKECVTSE